MADEPIPPTKEQQGTPAEPATSATPPAPGTSDNAALAADLAALRLEIALKDFGMSRGLSPDQLRLYQPHLVGADAGEWGEIVDGFRLVVPAQTTPSTGNVSVTPDPARAASDRGGPSSVPDMVRSEDPRQWTADHVQRMVASAKSEIEGIRAVKERFYAGLKGLGLVFPRGR